MKAVIIEKRFGDKLIFSNKTFQIPDNSATAILGPSGCGKTTLMRILSGLDDDFAGTVHPRPQHPVVLFQEDRLSERISVLSNLLAVTDDRKKAEYMLSRLSLEGEERSHIHELSGGMKRRVAIARSLLLDFDVLFLDEPFRGLDDAMKSESARLIMETAKGKIIVLITHDEEDLKLLGTEHIIKLG